MKPSTDLQIGTNRKRTRIVGTEVKNVGEVKPKLRFFIYTSADDGAEYKINEVWILNHNQMIEVRGLWVNYDDTGKALLSTSLLARFLKFMGVQSTQELEGKEIFLEPKANGFMAAVMYQ